MDQSLADKGKFSRERDQCVDGRSNGGFVVLGELSDELGNLTIVHGPPEVVACPTLA
jgi:hypothetical protein